MSRPSISAAGCPVYRRICIKIGIRNRVVGDVVACRFSESGIGRRQNAFGHFGPRLAGCAGNAGPRHGNW
jgi:hypothetical protein